ncbi:hypothetical protein DsansV1_C03g0028831 [Dioscorea sansibarensis]
MRDSQAIYESEQINLTISLPISSCRVLLAPPASALVFVIFIFQAPGLAPAFAVFVFQSPAPVVWCPPSHQSHPPTLSPSSLSSTAYHLISSQVFLGTEGWPTNIAWKVNSSL